MVSEGMFMEIQSEHKPRFYMKTPECVRSQCEKQYVITSLEVGIYQYKC